MTVTPGIDVLLDDDLALERFRDHHVGLVTNQTGVTRSLDYNREAMLEAGIDLVKLYSPEHGIWGVHGAGEQIDDYTDDLTGIPCHSLYGDVRTPTAEMLDGLDLLVFDIQDAGTRCWTYTATMINCMTGAATEGIPYVILDRPNPLTGQLLDGRPVEPGYESFVGHAGLPMVYGLTIGELADFANEEYDIGADLDVIELDGWDRSTWFDETGLLWGPSSPALFSLEKALIYPGTVLLEGTNLSSGDGRHGPMMMAAPWMAMSETVTTARETLAQLDLTGVSLRKAKFRAGGEVQHGFQIHVADRDRFKPFQTAVVLLHTIAQLHPDTFEWTNPDHADRLAGTSRLRDMISERPVDELVDFATEGVETFASARGPYLRY